MVIMAFQHNNSDDEHAECPLCMEPLDVDDLSFFPCSCGYQICRFCWHRIRTDENGLCPACRATYSENPAEFKPLTEEEMQRHKKQGKQKDQQQRRKTVESRKCLAGIRVVQRNLIFVVGLPPRLSDPELLKKPEYFGRFGKILKVVINPCTSYAGSQGPSSGAYVTYYRAEEAVRALDAVNNVHVDGRVLKASLGTTKYCSHYLKGTTCPKADCMYLHEPGEEAASFTKEDMQQGKHLEYEQWLKDQFQHILNHNPTQTQAIGKSKQTSPEPETTAGKNGTVRHQTVKESWPSIQQAPQQPTQKGHRRAGSGSAQGRGKKTDTAQTDQKQHRESPEAVGSTNGSRSASSSSGRVPASAPQPVGTKPGNRQRGRRQRRNDRTSPSPDGNPQPQSEQTNTTDCTESSTADTTESNTPEQPAEPEPLLPGLGRVPAHLQPFLVGDSSSVYSSQAGFLGMPVRPTESVRHQDPEPNTQKNGETEAPFGAVADLACTDWQQAFRLQLQQSGVDPSVPQPPSQSLASITHSSALPPGPSLPLGPAPSLPPGPTHHSAPSLPPQAQHSKPEDSGDGDLDFDPWSESSRALQEMLREPPAPVNHQPLQSSDPSGLHHFLAGPPSVPPPPGFSAPFTNAHHHNAYGGTSRFFPSTPVEFAHSEAHHGFAGLRHTAPPPVPGEAGRIQDLQKSLQAVFPNANVHIGASPRPVLNPQHKFSPPHTEPNCNWELHDEAIVSSGRLCSDHHMEPHWLPSIRQLTEPSDGSGSDLLQSSWPGASRQAPPPGFQRAQPPATAQTYSDAHNRLTADGSN